MSEQFEMKNVLGGSSGNNKSVEEATKVNNRDGDASVARELERLELSQLMGSHTRFHDCDYNPFHDRVTNEEWRVVKKGDGLEIVAGSGEDRIIAHLDSDMREQAERICLLINREQQEIPVEVIGYREDGDETFHDWYFDKVRNHEPHFPDLCCVSLSVSPRDDDTIIVSLNTELGCYGPGVRTRWDEPAWYVIQAAIELAARHVGEQVAHLASTLSSNNGARPQSAVRHH